MTSSRRMSIASNSSESGSTSPVLPGLNSSTSLVLVHDDEENTPFDFPSDDEDNEENDPQFDFRRAFCPPLPPSTVFLYLLSPYLKLGAMCLTTAGLSLKYGLPALFTFAVLSAFSRQIWYMLSRYIRKADLEEVILDSFARGRGKETRREILRSVVRAGTGLLRVLLSTIYFRESVHALRPLLPETLPISPVLFWTIIVTVVLLPLCLAQSLGSKRIIYATWTSIATYVLWLCFVAVAHARGDLMDNSGWLRLGIFWQGITATAFAFTSSPTLSLYASLKGSTPPISTAKSSISRSFKTLSILSVAVAVGLILPLVFFAASPNPEALSQDIPVSQLRPIIASLNAITLLLGIPSILVTSPSLPIPDRIRRTVAFSISKVLIFLAVALLSLVPTQVSRVLSDILIVCALSSTYFLPALLHITTHFFKRPLSIIMPQLPSTPTRPLTPEETQTPNDELLQRKERALQQRQFRKRLVWDVGVWVLLLPVGGGGFVWAVGRLVERW